MATLFGTTTDMPSTESNLPIQLAELSVENEASAAQRLHSHFVSSPEGVKRNGAASPLEMANPPQPQ